MNENYYASVDIIIPTLNRQEALQNTLKCLQKQTLRNFQIIIVDQSDEEISVVPDPGKEEIRFKYIHIKQKKLTLARNVGLQNSEAGIIIFIDDDVKLPGNFVEAHLNSYKNREKDNIGAVAGRIEENNKRCSVKGNTPKTMFGYNVFGRAYPNRGGDTFQEVLGFPGCNFSIRREVTKQNGYFDERFEGTALFEETDMAYRIRKAGYKIMFNPEARLFHLELPSGGCRAGGLQAEQYWRFRNAALFYLKNKNWLGIPLFFSCFICIAIWKAIELKDLKVFPLLVKGLFDGIIIYFTVKNRK